MSSTPDKSEFKGEVVVVTGGSGFLGQHIVRALLEQKKFTIRELRIFDLQPLRWYFGLEVPTSVPLRYIKGDICNVDDITTAFKDATVVIHNASVIDVTACPDEETMKRVNVQGTADVIQACKACDIQILIYTSSVDVLFEGINGVRKYGKTKRQAEKQVLQANDSKLSNGKRLFSCALRPAGMYGEGDPHVLIPLNSAVKTKVFCRVGDESGNYQLAYAGNVAESFVLAISKLIHKTGHLDETNSPAGRVMTITDDTPVQSLNKQLEPYVKAIGARMTSFYIPFFILHLLSAFFECVVWMLRPIYKFRSVFTKDAFWYLQNGPVINYEDASLFLGYKPIYSYEISLERSILYVKEHFRSNHF